MTMKKADRKESYKEIMELMLKDKNKEAFEKVCAMCGGDTGLFIFIDYDQQIKKLKAV